MPGYKHQLNAYLGEECIATLSLTDTNELHFFYHEQWQQHGYAISPHLPLDNSASTSQRPIKVFFQNTFPEGENFTILLENFHLSRYNIFAITQKLGLDLPGALQLILSTDALPKTSSFRIIQPIEIVERLKHYSAGNLMIWDGKLRLSLAGVHQKINVTIHQNGEMGLGEGKLCSTHILKFQRSPEQHLVLNEFLMMKLAKTIGLNVAEVELKFFEQYPTLLITRFDRTWENNNIKRRHAIDGCQALNLLPEYKYERNLGSGRDVAHIREGATLPALFKFCDSCRNPALAKKQLLELTLFNVIIGNLDAHAKNISFFISQSGIEFAPAYDLICIRIYPEFEQEMAMALGDEFDANCVNAYQLADFADSCHLSRDLVSRTLMQLCKQVSLALPNMQPFIQKTHENIFAKRLMDNIQMQIAHLEKQASLITSIDF